MRQENGTPSLRSIVISTFVVMMTILFLGAADCYLIPNYPELLRRAAVEGEIRVSFELIEGVPEDVVVSGVDMMARAQRAKGTKFSLKRYPAITRELTQCIKRWRCDRSANQKVTVTFEFRINVGERNREDAWIWKRFTVLQEHDGIPTKILIEAAGGFISE